MDLVPKWKDWSAEKPITAIVLGAGQRGKVHSTYALEFPDKFKVVAVAEPRKASRIHFQALHNIPDHRAYKSWRECLQDATQDKFADVVIIATPDQEHAQPAIAFASLKFHILLEKPMATTVEDCWAIHDAVKKNDVILAVCHVLRHAPAAVTLRRFADAGKLGEISNIQLLEPVGHWHFAHSFVRGNWRNEASSTFALLAKCCHDVDLIAFWKHANKCTKVSSFGNLQHFNAYKSWRECLQDATRDKFADVVIIATPDQEHAQPAIAFASLKFHILLEKPMATTVEDCWAIHDAVKKNDVILAVCHVLRHAPAAVTLRRFADAGKLGDISNIQLLEPVGHWHFAHSFVRGNWRNEASSTFALLAKCCHDVDLIAFWKHANKCTKVSSFGNLQHFKNKNKPAGASATCLTCSVENTCPYSAKKLYLDSVEKDPSLAEHWPVSVICNLEDFDKSVDLKQGILKCLEDGPYGRCVYDCDNDVCDNQVVNFEFDDGSTASLTMIAFSEAVCERRTTFFGTHGEMGGKFDQDSLEYLDFVTNKTELIPLEKVPVGTKMKGHGGTDFFLVDSFVRAVSKQDPSLVSTGLEESLKSHLLTFAAELSRKEGRVVTAETDPKLFL
ncbi:unnamed protein product [Notodromas monacha]|uniref:Gfo/Idh/MocA-like oxidoreductase N-terminal domain-containing protein n=1 Tax=Notodromas monacha TaxID=399045 RepID=A0A7R9BX80_9CRUS|nr:unnamed protein product [Notodromas monacha]CAG0923384.1 unnamed protein product [Notodromas monacha]